MWRGKQTMLWLYQWTLRYSYLFMHICTSILGKVTHVRRSKEWELIFPTPLSHKATRLNSIVSVSYPTCMGTTHLTILTKAIHSYIWQFSWISPSPITNSHLTFKHFKKNPSWKRLFLMKEFGTVSKIYFILKISEGKLEALRMSRGTALLLSSLQIPS